MVSKLLENVDSYLEKLVVPQLAFDLTEDDTLTFKNLAQATNKELEDIVSATGGWVAYLSIKISQLQSKKGAFGTAYEARERKSLAALAKAYAGDGKKKPNKDEMLGEVLTDDKPLAELLRDRIEVEAAHAQVEGLLNAYKQLYQTASRVISLRALGE